jgi:hypothetical protein
MANSPPSDPKVDLRIDLYLRLLREGITALIALAVVVTTLALVFQTLQLAGGTNGTDVAFQRGKDLLLFINPLLGVVLGYYFNKVTTEARAENAEATARQAATVAQAATTSRELAEHGARLAETKVDEVTRTLAELSDASERLLNVQTARVPGTLGGDGDGPGHDDARDELRLALAQARRQIG